MYESNCIMAFGCIVMDIRKIAAFLGWSKVLIWI
jgi:hypothetical protein